MEGVEGMFLASEKLCGLLLLDVFTRALRPLEKEASLVRTN